jgi:hypothetical protein
MPYIHTTRSHVDAANGSGIQIKMILRSVWEEDGACTADDREGLRRAFDINSIFPNKKYKVTWTMEFTEGKPSRTI